MYTHENYGFSSFSAGYTLLMRQLEVLASHQRTDVQRYQRQSEPLQGREKELITGLPRL